MRKLENIKEATDAILLPDDSGANENFATIIYYSPLANDGEGSFNLVAVSSEELLRLYSESNGNEESFFDLMMECNCYSYEAGTEKFETLVKAYSLADFIVGRDGNERDEMLFLVKWAKSRQGYEAGDAVWVLARDENGVPFDVVQQMYLATVRNAVITVTYLANHSVDDVTACLIESTRFNMDTDIEVFPLQDCFFSEEDAKKALDSELKKIADASFVDPKTEITI